MPEVYNEQNQLVLSLLCIAALIASGILYARTGTSDEILSGQNSTNNSVAGVENENIEDNVHKNINGEIIQNITRPKLVIKPQPTCPPIKKDEELNGICRELLFIKFSCKPEDVMDPNKHKIPKYYYQNIVKNNSSNETQNTIVNYIIAVLLLTSLGAALLEFYRAKLSPTDTGKKGNKPPLNRKCSLADLTVLKHHRKELVRRESILEHHSEETTSSGNTFQGLKPSPLHRRCSFPTTFPPNEVPAVGGGGRGFSARQHSRKYSMTTDINRRLSVVNDSGRKLSMVTDEDIWRRGSLVGEDTSPDRRHHTRLVHRH